MGVRVEVQPPATALPSTPLGFVLAKESINDVGWHGGKGLG